MRPCIHELKRHAADWLLLHHHLSYRSSYRSLSPQAYGCLLLIHSSQLTQNQKAELMDLSFTAEEHGMPRSKQQQDILE